MTDEDLVSTCKAWMVASNVFAVGLWIFFFLALTGAGTSRWILFTILFIVSWRFESHADNQVIALGEEARRRLDGQ